MIFYKRYLNISIIIGLGINGLFLPSVYARAHYQRCWLENGQATINCNPADGYFFKKENNIYKKCPVASGKLQKTCKTEDGYGLFFENYHWYQCPVQQGKKTNPCTLASGYQIIKKNNKN